MKDFEKKAKTHALKNAIAHEGKAISSAVISGLFSEGLKPEDMKIYGKEINIIVNDINKLSLDEQKIEFEKLKEIISERETREGLPELPNVDKKGVIMRIAPAPSGALHIGHAITSAINLVYVKKYGGKFICRIEDTNPETIYAPAYKLIEQDIKWLTKNKVKFIVQSDRMKIYYRYAKKLINLNSAYICTCFVDEFKKFSDSKKNCPCRDNSIKENLIKWKKMLDIKGYSEGEAVLRFKSNMNSPNPAMRDFPLARINETKHPRQGNKYRVWPLMNLAVAVDDIEMRLTHLIRGKEHADNAKRQEMIFNVLGEKYPWNFFMGKWHIKGLKLSKRGLREAIESGKYTGWDDPKLPTIQSLIKRGYKPEAFWLLAEKRGLSNVDKIISKKDFFALLENFNKEIEKKENKKL